MHLNQTPVEETGPGRSARNSQPRGARRQTIPPQVKPWGWPQVTIQRAALMATLRRGMSAGLQVIEAPAGYGKTVVAAQFARAMSRETVWVDFTGDRSRIHELVEHIAEALRGEAADDRSPTTVTHGRARAVKAHGGPPTLFILDSLERVVDPDDLAMLDAALGVARGRADVLLLGRSVGLRSVTRAVVSERARLITARDLCFSLSEIVELSERAGVTVVARSIEAETAGWPAAVAAKIGEASAPADGRDLKRLWEVYVEREVLAELPPALVDRLTVLSFVPADSGRLGAEVLGRNAWCEVRDAFARWSALADARDPSCVHLHPAIRDVLAARHGGAPTGAASRLARRGFRRVAARGDARLALQFAITAGLHKEVAAILQENGARLLLSGLSALVVRAVDSLGGLRWSADVTLLALRAQALADIDPVAAYREAEAVITRRDWRAAPRAIDTEAFALTAFLAARKRPNTADVAATARRLSTIAPNLTDSAHILAVGRLIQHLHLPLGKPRTALDLAERLARASERDHLENLATHPAAVIRELLSECEFSLGLVDRAIASAGVAVTRLTVADGDLYVRTHNNLGIYHLLSGDPAKALIHINAALDHGAVTSLRMQLHSRLSLCEILIYNTELKEAETELTRIITVLHNKHEDNRLLCLAHVQFSILARIRGDYDSAVLHADSSLQFMRSSSLLNVDMAFVYTEYCVTMLVCGLTARIFTIVSELLRSAQASGNTYAITRAYVILWILKHIESCSAPMPSNALASHLQIANENIHERYWIETLIKDLPLSLRSSVPDFDYRLEHPSKASKTTDHKIRATVRPMKSVPVRLRRVLVLISQGLSNLEISRRLALSEHTVENYVSELLNLLHCRNRTELAVMAIRIGGFLNPSAPSPRVDTE